MNKLIYWPRYVAISVIRFYQRTLSFDHGLLKIFHPLGYCRFKPTCSEYAISAIEKHGLRKGGLMACWRLVRCNPWNPGGYDPVK